MARSCKVLVVENDSDICEFRGLPFEAEGHLFAMVETGAQMRAALGDEDYDLVIIDVTQPGHQGGFAPPGVARAEGCGAIPVTGDHRLSERLAASGECYLLKPFRVHRLVEILERVLADAGAKCVRHKRGDGSFFPARAE